MAVDLGKKDEELRKTFEELGVTDLEEQIRITEKIGQNPQIALQQEETEVQNAELEI